MIMLPYAFREKNLHDELLLAQTDGSYNYKFNKPLICPICGERQDAQPCDNKLFQGPERQLFAAIRYRCNSCSKFFLAIYDVNCSNGLVSFGTFHPQINVAYEDKLLEAFSPRFIYMYNQALTCEKNGHIELAAIGFRSALEFLVKDYAISELKKDRKEVSEKLLAGAIGSYLDSESIKSADVVRILGNDYTHYKRDYPQHDFEILKTYMNIFIQQIRAKLLIAHPPVERDAAKN